jgi:hypothetical protein
MIEEGEVQPGVLRRCEACGHRDDYPAYADRCIACSHRFGEAISRVPAKEFMILWHCGPCDKFHESDYRFDARCSCGKTGIIGRAELPGREP